MKHKYVAKANKKKPYEIDLLEEEIHLAIAQYLDLVIKRPSRWHTVEVSNQANGWAAMHRQKRLKAKGVRTGWPDIEIMHRHTHEYYWSTDLIFLEVKSATGKLTEKQEALHNELKDDGHYVYVVRSVEDVKEILGNLRII